MDTCIASTILNVGNAQRTDPRIGQANSLKDFPRLIVVLLGFSQVSARQLSF